MLGLGNGYKREVEFEFRKGGSRPIFSLCNIFLSLVSENVQMIPNLSKCKKITCPVFVKSMYKIVIRSLLWGLSFLSWLYSKGKVYFGRKLRKFFRHLSNVTLVNNIFQIISFNIQRSLLVNFLWPFQWSFTKNIVPLKVVFFLRL